jgi:ParB family chromosome partitioning protein
VRPNSQQPREVFARDALTQLAESIDTLGLMMPPTVREVDGGFELIAGERRWRACIQLGHPTIPVLVAAPDDDPQVLAMAIAENAARVPLNAVEEAHAFAALLDGSGLSQSELGRRIGKSQEDVSNSVRLLRLPDAALKFLMDGKLTKAHGKVLLSEPDHDRRAELARRAASQGWSVRQLQHEVNRSAVAAAPRRALSADMTAAADRWTEALRSATGSAMTIRATAAGFQLELGDAAAARNLLVRVGVAPDALDEPEASIAARTRD